MSYNFRYQNHLIDVISPQTVVDCQDLYNKIVEEEASERGICFSPIATASGKQFLGTGVQVGITVQLLEPWQLNFYAGNYVATIAGGNFVGGKGGDPVAYTPGVQVLLIQSAASTVVNTNGSIPTANQNAQAVLAAMNTSPPDVNIAKVNGYTVDGTGTDNNPWGPV